MGGNIKRNYDGQPSKKGAERFKIEYLDKSFDL